MIRDRVLFFITYFVKKGSMIADVEVKDILKDKVILTDGREEIEIR